MTVRVYVDAHTAAADPTAWVPTTSQVAAHLHPAAVRRSKDYDGFYVRNHAKFLAIDHRVLLVSSASFSWSAEQWNVEFGVCIDNVAHTESVEREMQWSRVRCMNEPRYRRCDH